MAGWRRPISAYARALTLDPANAAARAELLATPAGQAPPPVVAAAPASDPLPPLRSPGAPAAPPTAAMPESSAPPTAAAPESPAPPPVSERQSAVPHSAPPAALEPRPAEVPAAPAPLPQPPAAAMADGTLVLDASDLIEFFRYNRAPTGIQRVQLGIIGAALDQAPETRLAVFEPASGGWKPLPAETFRRLAALSGSGADAADPDWSGAMANTISALLHAPPLAFPPGAVLVNLGTAWWLPDYLRRVREAKAAAPGLRYVAFLHDCIPLVVPEHCAAGLVDEFARWFAGLCLHADLVLCNSACTEADFRRFSRAMLPDGAPEIPTAVVRLDAVTPLGGSGPIPGEALPQPLRAGRPYVLSVGTIESRKNHLMLFQAWLALLRRHGPEVTPRPRLRRQAWLAGRCRAGAAREFPGPAGEGAPAAWRAGHGAGGAAARLPLHRAEQPLRGLGPAGHREPGAWQARRAAGALGLPRIG